MNQVWQLQYTKEFFDDIIKNAKAHGVQVIQNQEQEEFVVLPMKNYQQLLFPVSYDLDRLAGTWNESQTQEFLSVLADFSQIDEDLWH